MITCNSRSEDYSCIPHGTARDPKISRLYCFLFVFFSTPEHNTALATTSRRLALAPCTSPDEDDDGGGVDGGEQATAMLRQGRVEEVVGAGGGKVGGGGAGGSEIAEMGEVVVSGERVMAVLTGEGGWTVKKSGGESVLESALRLVGERNETGGRRQTKKKQKRKDRGRNQRRMERNA